MGKITSENVRRGAKPLMLHFLVIITQWSEIVHSFSRVNIKKAEVIYYLLVQIKRSYQLLQARYFIGNDVQNNYVMSAT